MKPTTYTLKSIAEKLGVSIDEVKETATKLNITAPKANSKVEHADKVRIESSIRRRKARKARAEKDSRDVAPVAESRLTVVNREELQTDSEPAVIEPEVLPPIQNPGSSTTDLALQLLKALSNVDRGEGIAFYDRVMEQGEYRKVPLEVVSSNLKQGTPDSRQFQRYVRDYLMAVTTDKELLSVIPDAATLSRAYILARARFVAREEGFDEKLLPVTDRAARGFSSAFNTAKAVTEEERDRLVVKVLTAHKAHVEYQEDRRQEHPNLPEVKPALTKEHIVAFVEGQKQLNTREIPFSVRQPVSWVMIPNVPHRGFSGALNRLKRVMANADIKMPTFLRADLLKVLKSLEDDTWVFVNPDGDAWFDVYLWGLGFQEVLRVTPHKKGAAFQTAPYLAPKFVKSVWFSNSRQERTEWLRNMHHADIFVHRWWGFIRERMADWVLGGGVSGYASLVIKTCRGEKHARKLLERNASILPEGTEIMRHQEWLHNVAPHRLAMERELQVR